MTSLDSSVDMAYLKHKLSAGEATVSHIYFIAGMLIHTHINTHSERPQIQIQNPIIKFPIH